MKESVDSLEKNVETFVSNRRAEGAHLLSQIEQVKSSAAGGQAAAEQRRMQELMERLSMDPKASPSQGRPPSIPPLHSAGSGKTPHPQSAYITSSDPRFTIPPRESPVPVGPNGYSRPSHSSPVPQNPQNISPIDSHGNPNPNFAQGAAAPVTSGYNPMMYPERNIASPISVNAQQQYPNFPSMTSPPPGPAQINTFFQHPHQNPPSAQSQSAVQPMNFTSPTTQYAHYSYQHPQHQGQPSPGYQTFQAAYGMPQNYVPPPPPPGPPGGGSSTQYPPNAGQSFPSGPGGYASYNRPSAHHSSAGTGQGSMGSTGYGSSAGSGAPQYQQPQQQQQPADPWSGLSAWK